MRICVASFASLNAGSPLGEWIELDGMDADGLRERIADLLRRSPSPDDDKWAVLAYDDFPDLGEHPDIDQLIERAEAITVRRRAEGIWADRHGTDAGFLEAYYGTAESWEHVAAQVLKVIGAVPEHLWPYIDLDAFARSLRSRGWWGERDSEGKLHVFVQ